LNLIRIMPAEGSVPEEYVNYLGGRLAAFFIASDHPMEFREYTEE
jgi:hypothetical protein